MPSISLGLNGASRYVLAFLLLLLPLCGRSASGEMSPDEYCWSLPDTLLGRDFSMFVTVLDTDFRPGPEAKFGYTGDRFGPMIFRFVEDGDDLVLEQAVGYELPDSTGVGSDLKTMYSERAEYMEARRFHVISRENGKIRFDVRDWMNDDMYFGLQPYAAILRLGMKVEQSSRVVEVKHLPGQLIVRSELKYAPIPLPSAPKDTTTWTVGTCLSLLPEEKMEPVCYDRRVGYFNIPAAKVSVPGVALKKKSVIKRFRNGVTFCIHPDFPDSLRPAVRRAVETWDRIFLDYGLDGRVKLEEPAAEDLDGWYTAQGSDAEVALKAALDEAGIEYNISNGWVSSIGECIPGVGDKYIGSFVYTSNTTDNAYQTYFGTGPALNQAIGNIVYLTYSTYTFVDYTMSYDLNPYNTTSDLMTTGPFATA